MRAKASLLAVAVCLVATLSFARGSKYGDVEVERGQIKVGSGLSKEQHSRI